VIPIFIGKMMAREQPTIFGDGTQSRDFTYIENVISANVLACQAASDKVGGRVFNIAAGKNFSLNTVYSMLQELTGFDRPALFAPPRGGDVRDSLADTTRAMEAMGYKTLVDFKEGLRRTVEWYKTN
jgi:nucleoside-diphosphate-sugar epimerase